MTGHGDLKNNVCIYLGVFVIANAACVIVPEFYSLIFLRAIAGVAAGAFLACGITASTRLSTNEKKGKSISTIMAGMAIGTVIGVPASLVIADHFGWRSAMIIVSILGGIAFIGLYLCLPALPSTMIKSEKSRFALLSEWPVVRVILISLFAAISSLGMYTFLSPFVSAVDKEAYVTVYLWYWGLGGVCGSILIGYFVDDYDLKKNPVHYSRIAFAVISRLGFTVTYLSAADRIAPHYMGCGWLGAASPPEQRAIKNQRG